MVFAHRVCPVSTPLLCSDWESNPGHLGVFIHQSLATNDHSGFYANAKCLLA